MLIAYFDDSGTHRSSSVVAVAGYVSTTLRWKAFDPEWRRLLFREKIKFIHMAELESLRGQFTPQKGWTKARREGLFAKAAKIIERRTRNGTAVGHAVIKDDWERIVPQSLKKMLGGPYGWCAKECVVQVATWKKKQGIKGDLHIVFEAGTEGEGQIHEMLRTLIKDPSISREYGIHGYNFYDKTMLPLHAADMLAYEVYKEAENFVVYGGKRDVRPPLILLRGRHDSKHFHYADERYLKEWLVLQGIR